ARSAIAKSHGRRLAQKRSRRSGQSSARRDARSFRCDCSRLFRPLSHFVHRRQIKRMTQQPHRKSISPSDFLSPSLPCVYGGGAGGEEAAFLESPSLHSF